MAKRTQAVRKPARKAVATYSPAVARAWIALLAVLAVLASMVLWSGALLVLVGILPSLSVMLIDREEGHPLTRTVAAANAVGILAAILDYRTGANSFAHALQALMNGMTLLKMYGAAGVGWLIYLGMPMVVVSYLDHADASLRKELEKRQEEIVKEWGPEASSTEDK